MSRHGAHAPEPAAEDTATAGSTGPSAAVVVVLAVIGLVTYSGQKNDQRGPAEGAELTQKFQAAGLPVPPTRTSSSARSAPTAATSATTRRNALGKAHPLRPADQRRRLRRPPPGHRRPAHPAGGEALILQTYCPDKLQELPGQDRQPEDRQHASRTDAEDRPDRRRRRTGEPGPTGRRRRRRARGGLRLGARGQRQHLGGDDPAAVDQRGLRTPRSRSCSGR